ncbi:hypothetical protein NZK35_32130 [Stieleria sp. ICT_E10.1]|uniref:hypothetical protein n=1 Tax=Stieleria sedimenti TaxID=2976331 RepID=UPI00217FAA14|nr:hypothetical protein [Stieleria sedimenti]MCS7471327.1 hypothetical protein [Stieleria sedimenti]
MTVRREVTDEFTVRESVSIALTSQTLVYVEDPFGIVFELYSHSDELTYSAGAYS